VQNRTATAIIIIICAQNNCKLPS